MSKQVERIETTAILAEELVRAVATGDGGEAVDCGDLEALLAHLKGRPLAQGRSLMTEKEVEALAIRGRFEDRRRQALDAAQAVVDALRHSGIPTRSIYLVKENMLGQKQIEAAFAVSLNPAGKTAVLAPVPMAGNAKVSEVAHMRQVSAASLLKMRYYDGWQVFILSTEGRLKDSEVLAPLGVRFPNSIPAKDKAGLMAGLGAAVKIGLPAPADEALDLQAEGWGNYIAGLVKVMRRVLPRGLMRAEIELDLNAISGSDLLDASVDDGR